MLVKLPYLVLLISLFSSWIHSEEFECGVSNFGSVDNRVVSGDLCKRGELPWIAFTRTCTASIISRNYVLTAGHCVDDDVREITVGFGVAGKNDPEAIKMTSKNIIRHEKNRRCKSKGTGKVPLFDIAVIELTRSLNFSEYVNSICLKKSSEENSNRTALISGFGWNKFVQAPLPPGDAKDEKLRRGTAKFVGSEECRKDWSAVEECISEVPLLCAKGEHGVDVYIGDSGGPISVKNEKRNDGKTQWMQVGVTSFVDVEAFQFRPSVFTPVTSYCDWITEATKGEVKCID
ncbi:trypsin domain-containing protein [Ditylenchus destructor]|uniref:Trypsin domain-containing protein n=1 Tax=Ditylenchus destructor TaxID=166010 RepID=A0AAD4N0P9_9BILA|nr:trypsin domain-containing protein [Ditylenchus destructor]